MYEIDDLESARLILADRIAGLTKDSNGVDTLIDGLGVRKYEAPTEPASYMHAPSLCLSVQGAKRVVLGEDTYVYDDQHYLITSIDVPVVANIVEASPEKPYMAVVYKLDLKELAQIITDSSVSLPEIRQADRGMAVSKITLPILNAFIRLLDLLNEPDNIPLIAPLIHREILFRLLKTEQGMRLRQLAKEGNHGYQIAKAINWLKDNFDKPLRVDDLASYASMSTSSLHQHFRTMTSMSPLQYQKWLRLHEAKRLMLTEHFDAANAAFQVGYESPSHFSREYKRLFGAPPLRDIKSLNDTARVV